MNRKRVEARNALENFSYSCRSAVRDDSSPAGAHTHPLFGST